MENQGTENLILGFRRGAEGVRGAIRCFDLWSGMSWLMNSEASYLGNKLPVLSSEKCPEQPLC